MTGLDEDLSPYEGLDTCVISDAIDALGGPESGFGRTLAGASAAWAGARVLGWAVTMKLARGPAPAGGVHLGVRAISLSRPGNVIVVDAGGLTGMGSWGGLLSTAASVRGVGGVLSSGSVRDIDEARELSFPVFCAGATPRTARGRCHEVSCGEPVSVDGFLIAAGDLIAADGTGVLAVPRARAHAVLGQALELAQHEAGMRAALLDGADPVRVLGGGYEDMLTAGPAEGTVPGEDEEKNDK
jgi:4-hydroxy-4-methyl-2-oxoglutarate aldolase